MVICYFLGNACIEIESKHDHIIIDPVFLSPPQKGIEKVFLTHHHSDHVSQEKITKILNIYKKKGKELDIYGPLCVCEELAVDLTLIQPNSRIKLNEGFIEVFKNKCWNAEDCVSYMVNLENKKILHTADSAEFSDELRAISTKIDLCFVACFENNYNDYLGFLNTISAKIVIPYHFNKEKIEEAKNLYKFLKKNGINSRLLSIGEKFDL